MKSQPLEQFEKSWKFIRSMTYEFIKAVPEPHWMQIPAPGYSPIAKQFRHMVWVSGLFNKALVERQVELKNKKSCYDGRLVKESLISALQDQDKILLNFLSGLTAEEADGYLMDFFGKPMGLYEFLNNMIQHETMHHGMWALYARLAPYPTPGTWQGTWKL
jgi:uncharacterized damage-inducible protein DinB